MKLALCCSVPKNNLVGAEVLKELHFETGCGTAEADLTAAGACERAVSEALSHFDGRLTTLINCAGVLQPGAFGSDACNLANFEHNFAGNTRSTFEMMVNIARVV